ncbi:hypothetical protein QUH73_07830 [Labilibaculum sp. K2S]|uniref:TorF family putative porin n=1 Tax=Labilibaculum sp. K2S TaxID=3056386 RepID=UPI0025A3EC83|nr:TorF family putative porin [Labilibaculum sp. K2S]MDM8159718.1 hypothetical protein [Labilibaculum sp. K2S]
MKRSGVYLLLAFMLSFSIYSFGQKEKAVLDFGADVMSRYVWRGTQFGGTSPSLQPSASLSYKGLELGAWGAYSLGGNNAGQEFDLYLAYTFAKDLFSLTLTDYYFPTEGEDYEYFEFNNDRTGHVLEGSFRCNGNDNIPFALMVAVNFWGADAVQLGDNPNTADFNQKTGLQYSTYTELSYSHKMANNVTLDAFLGVNLTKPAKAKTSTGFNGESGYYGSKAGVVNLGVKLSKEVALNEKFSLPVSASVITNPADEKIYFVFGFSF